MNDIKLFNSRKIRSVWFHNEWYFAVVDVVEVLTDSSNPRNYWSTLKKREKEKSGVELSTFCVQLKVEAGNGRMYSIDCASKQGLFRIIQSVPSPKAEPFKQWLAKVGSDYLDEKTSKRLAAHKKLKETQARFMENVQLRGVDRESFKKVLEKGDEGLFGGENMREKFGLKENEDLDDYLNTVLLKGKDFATEVSNYKVAQNELEGEEDISEEHKSNNFIIREHLLSKDIKPEELQPEESIKKLKNREKPGLKSGDKD